MFEAENQLDSCGRNSKALFVCVKCLVNYTLTRSHCKHSPSLSRSLSFSLPPSLCFTNTRSLLGGWLGSVWCVFWEFQGVVLCLCVPARPFRSSPSLPPWTHSLPGPALWLVVWWRRHSPSSTPSSFVSQMVHFHLHVQLLSGLPGETPPLECALHRDPLINPCVV